MDQKEFLIKGLNNAYAMEKGIEQALITMEKDLEDHPGFQENIHNHIRETRNHAEAVKRRIEDLDGDVSETKSAISQFTSLVQGLASKLMPYKSLKHLSAAYATENFEIATYRQLQVIADLIGDKETSRICQNIIIEEINMAKRIETTLPMIVEMEIDMKIEAV